MFVPRGEQASSAERVAVCLPDKNSLQLLKRESEFLPKTGLQTPAKFCRSDSAYSKMERAVFGMLLLQVISGRVPDDWLTSCKPAFQISYPSALEHQSYWIVVLIDMESEGVLGCNVQRNYLPLKI